MLGKHFQHLKKGMGEHLLMQYDFVAVFQFLDFPLKMHLVAPTLWNVLEEGSSYSSLPQSM